MFRVNASISSRLIHEPVSFPSQQTYFYSQHVHRSPHRSTSMYQSYDFAIQNFRMISATVIGLRLQFLTKKNDAFLHQRHLRLKKKERKISGVAWTPLDTKEHRIIMATRYKFRGLSLRLILGAMTCLICNLYLC